MKLIIACDPNGGIGYQNRLPWSKIQGDLPRFKELTNNKTVIMGRNTWDSLPSKPLPSRFSIVITSEERPNAPGVIFRPYDFMVTLNDFDRKHSWMIGGAKLIDACWHDIDEVHLTRVYQEYTCDSFIDLVYLENNFVRTHSELFSDHHYQIWKRKN